jgi:hypothetical protein
MWPAFVIASLTCVGGCAGLDEGGVHVVATGERVEIVGKGDPAPDDGVWLSRRTFLLLYEAAENWAISRGTASQRNTRHRSEPPALARPAPKGQAPQSTSSRR